MFPPPPECVGDTVADALGAASLLGAGVAVTEAVRDEVLVVDDDGVVPHSVVPDGHDVVPDMKGQQTFWSS